LTLLGAGLAVGSVTASLLSSGQRQLAAGQYAAARETFQAAVTRHYSDAAAHFGLGLALDHLKDYQAARFEFQEVLRLKPGLPEAEYNLGVVYQQLGNTSAAIVAYRAALGGSSKLTAAQRLETNRNLAALEVQAGNHAAAAKLDQAALKLAPKDLKLWLDTAEQLYLAGQAVSASSPLHLGGTATALPYAYHVLARQPGNVKAVELIADVYLSQKLTNQALQVLHGGIAAATTPLDRAALLRARSRIEESGGQVAAELADLKRAVRLVPGDASGQLLYAQALLRNAQPRRALVHFEAALMADSTSGAAMLGIALVEEHLGANLLAAEDAASAVRLTHTASVKRAAQFLEARSDYRSGHFTEALPLLQELAAQKPTVSVQLWLGLTEFSLKKYSAAMRSLAAAEQADPQNLLIAADLGGAALAAGHFNAAAKVLRAVVQAQPKNGQAWYNLGWSLRGQGHLLQAKAAFKKALALGYAPAKAALGG
jgi:tetratricopeptide (TPR) repeat protein